MCATSEACVELTCDQPPVHTFGSDTEDSSMSAARLLQPLARTIGSAGRTVREGPSADVEHLAVMLVAFRPPRARLQRANSVAQRLTAARPAR